MYHNIYEFKDICKIHCKSLEWECLTFFIILVIYINPFLLSIHMSVNAGISRIYGLF